MKRDSKTAPSAMKSLGLISVGLAASLVAAVSILPLLPVSRANEGGMGECLDGKLADLRSVEEDPDGTDDNPLEARFRDRFNRPSGLNIKAIRYALNSGERNGTLWVGLAVGDNNPFDVDGNLNHLEVNNALQSDLSDRTIETYRVRAYFGPGELMSPAFVDFTLSSDFSVNSTGLPEHMKDPNLFQLLSPNLRSGNVRHSIGIPSNLPDTPGSGFANAQGSPSDGVEFRVTNIHGLIRRAQEQTGIFDSTWFNRVTFDASTTFTCAECTGPPDDEHCPSADVSGEVPDLYTVAVLAGAGAAVGGSGLPESAFEDPLSAVSNAPVFVRIRVNNTGPDRIDNIVVTNSAGANLNTEFEFPMAGGSLASGASASATFTFNAVIGGLDSFTCSRTDTFTAVGTSPRGAEGSSDTATLVCLGSALKTSVTVDDDGIVEDASDRTPRSQRFRIVDDYPITLIVTIRTTNDSEVNGPADMARVRLRSAALEALGWIPPMPFSLVQDQTRMDTFRIEIPGLRECLAIDGLDGVVDGVFHFDVTAEGEYIVVDGIPASSDSSGMQLPLPIPRGSGMAIVECNLSPGVPTLSTWGLAVLALALAWLLLRAARPRPVHP